MLEAGAYRQAKEMTDAATTAEQVKALPKSRMFALVREIEFDLFKEHEARVKGGESG